MHISLKYILPVTFSFILYACNHSSTIHAARKDIYQTVYASGKIIAANEHTIFATSNGTVIKKMVSDEDTVKEKQPLFEIQNIAATSALKVSPGKIKILQQFSPSESLKEVSTIQSDCNGIVFQTMIRQGEFVHINQPIALIGDAEKRIIQLSVDQQDIDKIKPGQQVLLKTDITDDTIYKATVTKIYSLMNEADQSFRVDASFNEIFLHAFIHNAVEANIVVNQKKDALVIPRYTIAGKDSLLVKANGVMHKIKVETGIVSSDYIEIINGIDEHTEIVAQQEK